MAETPSCNDSQWQLVSKILIQLHSQATNAPTNLLPGCNDTQDELYRKILLTFAYF